MIVRGLNLVGIASLPSETYPILIIDSNTVLPAPVSAQPFEVIPSWNSELAKVSNSIDLIELPPANLPQDTGTSPPGNGRVDPIKDVLGALPTKRPYHGLYYNDIRDNHQSLPYLHLRRDDSDDPLSKTADRSLHGSGSPGYWLNPETSDRPHKRGAIAMAKVPRDFNDNGSQFYICVDDNNGLGRTYTVFGEVFRGMEVVDKIVAAARDEFDNPLEPITMTMTVKE